jgi:hypothetical protein
MNPVNVCSNAVMKLWSANLNISKNIAYEWSLLSAILISEGQNKIFFLPTYPQVKLLSRIGETNNILI